jgi:hypothetical protein
MKAILSVTDVTVMTAARESHWHIVVKIGAVWPRAIQGGVASDWAAQRDDLKNAFQRSKALCGSVISGPQSQMKFFLYLVHLPRSAIFGSS